MECTLILKAKIDRERMTDRDREKWPDYFIGYYLKLKTSLGMSCLVRTAIGRPPTKEDKHKRRTGEVPYLNRVINNLQKIADAQREHAPYPEFADRDLKFEIHLVDTGKHTLAQFLEQAEVHRVLTTIKEGGCDG